MLEDDGKEPSPSVFDTIILEILYNDMNSVLGVEPVQKPVAGELAGNSSTTVDAFTRKPIRPIKMEEVRELFASPKRKPPKETQLMLRLPTGDPIGAYRKSTGRAGISDFQKPFTISPSRGPVSVAMGKVTTGMKALAVGKTHIVAVGTVLMGGKPLCMESVLGEVNVVESEPMKESRMT
jgi:hypothetical protein